MTAYQQRHLNLDSDALSKVRRVVNHAKKKANWFNPSVPGWINRIPGHDRKHQIKLNDFRCVFSYTVDRANHKVVRHLSVSVPSEHFPHPVAVKFIASLFGFSGSDGELTEDFPSDWHVHVKNDGPIDDHCIVVGQDTGIRI
ncbi:MAG: hypothetical protein JRG90_12560 [Deltaproteobacteria bacterium]|nr:hypothetical protein [Deltaproteobacteria bacterium]